jgi:regulator of replication initiation timing
LLEAQEQNRRLCDELAQARAVKPEAAPKGLASVMVDKLQKQVNELKLENEQLRAGRPGASARPPELFHDLSSQVDRLRRDNEEMRTRQSAMQAENDGLRRSLFDAQKQLRQAPSRPAEPAGRKATPTSAFLRHLISEDPQDHLYGAQVPADEFLITEQFVCFRKVEKVVTRIAGELKQLISADTVIPGTDGANFRRLAQAVLETPGEDGARQAMCAYMDEFGKWFGISTLAYRRASTRMIEDVKKNLSEQGLTKNRPLGSLAIGKLAQAELWARSQQYLKELSQSSIESRIEELARKEAENLQLGTSPDQLPQS